MAEPNWKAKYEELHEAVVEFYRVQNPGSSAMPYSWALRATKKASYRLRVLVGLIDPERVPIAYR